MEKSRVGSLPELKSSEVSVVNTRSLLTELNISLRISAVLSVGDLSDSMSFFSWMLQKVMVLESLSHTDPTGSGISPSLTSST